MELDFMLGLFERLNFHRLLEYWTGEKHGKHSHVRKMDFLSHTIPVSGGWGLAGVVLNNSMGIRPGRSQLVRLAALNGWIQAIPQVVTSG